MSFSMSRKVYGSACIHGADEIVTACPLCRNNLVKNGMGEEASVPVVYFTELMAEAFGIKNGAANGARQWSTAAALSTERSN